MVEEVGELELGDELSEGKLQEFGGGASLSVLSLCVGVL